MTAFRRHARGCHSQRGVALLTAMLVVALATIVAVSMMRARQMHIHRASNVIHGAQAWQYALGLEAWAQSILHKDLVTGRGIDTPNEAWAGRLPVIPVPGGRLSGSLTELNGRFNVNTLAGEYGDLQMRRFRRLLQVLGLSPVLAVRVRDWLDANSQPRPGGAEDYAYTGLSPPYRAANDLFTHPSELRLILGLGEADWARLAPHVSTLPRTDTVVNVNTATIPVLMSLSPKITRQMAEALAKAGRAGFSTVEQFVDSRILRGVYVPAEGLGVQSHYFLAHGVVELDDSVYHFYSLIERRGELVVLRRTRGIR